MTVEELRKVVHATPFQTFKITSQDETLCNLIDLLLVTDVEVEGSASANR
jgi:hypothetical protein